MSNASNYVQDTTQTPAWAQAILDRLAALEGNPATEPIDVDSTDEDPAVVPRSPDLDFHPYDDFRKALPSMDKDFFRNPLSEADRRRYLSQCPRNMERNYQPPVLNQVSISNSAKRMDSQLADIQYRLSGITRPLDFLLHKSITAGPPNHEDVVHFVRSVHELLSDTASYVTQIRMDNMFKSAGIRGQAPRLAPTQATPLMEPKELLEHANLAKSTMQIGRSNNRRGKAYSSRGPAADHNRVDSSANENHPRPSSNNPFRKDFRSQAHPKDHHPQRASK
jgi:hypothetical protein